MKKILTLAALLSFGCAFAQVPSTSIGFIEHNDTVIPVKILHENAPHIANLPDVPRFALFGREGKFYMGIGANVGVTGIYDFGSPLPKANEFITSSIPFNTLAGNGAEMRFNAQRSNVYLNIVALPGQENQLGAYVNIKFTGNGYTPALDMAYLRYRGITAGYAFSIFSDASAAPATIDKQGPNAFTGVVHGMIAYEPAFGKNKEWKVGIGLDNPTNSFTNATHTATVSQRIPDIPFYVQRSWADGDGWIRMSGIIRNLYYRDLVSQHNIDKVGWGIKTSGSTPIAGGLTAMWQAVYGKGIASYIQDLTGTGMDLMPNPSDPDGLEAVKVWAGYAALRYQIAPKWFCTATYSHVRTYAHSYADSSSDWKSGYRYAQYVCGNVFYNINSIVQVGAEYLYGRRVDFGGMQAHDNRLEALLQVSF